MPVGDPCLRRGDGESLINCKHSENLNQNPSRLPGKMYFVFVFVAP